MDAFNAATFDFSKKIVSMTTDKLYAVKSGRPAASSSMMRIPWGPDLKAWAQETSRARNASGGLTRAGEGTARRNLHLGLATNVVVRVCCACRTMGRSSVPTKMARNFPGKEVNSSGES